MIYLNAEVRSGLGEDTFWTWFHREFPLSSFDVPTRLTSSDIVLRYSTLGSLTVPGKHVALCWELYPEMQKVFQVNQWSRTIEKVNETARYATYRTVATEYTKSTYSCFGTVEVIPIGVDISVFKPMKNKKALREKYNIPQNKEVGIWIGTLHPMKGYVELLKFASLRPNIHWIVIWKWHLEALDMPNATNFVKIPQSTIAELVNAADFALFTSMLKPYYMAEWEVMACNIPIINIGADREFIVANEPLETVMLMGWDRPSLKQKWKFFLDERGIKC